MCVFFVQMGKGWMKDRADCILCGSFGSVCKLVRVQGGRMDLMCDMTSRSKHFMMMGVSTRAIVIEAGWYRFLWHRYDGGGFEA